MTQTSKRKLQKIRTPILRFKILNTNMEFGFELHEYFNFKTKVVRNFNHAGKKLLGEKRHSNFMQHSLKYVLDCCFGVSNKCLGTIGVESSFNKSNFSIFISKSCSILAFKSHSDLTIRGFLRSFIANNSPELEGNGMKNKKSSRV